MPRTDYSLQTHDGLTLIGQRWVPTDSPRGIVCLIHGLGEHSSRYAYVAEKMNSAGYIFEAIDLRGHGRSDGPRGHSPSFDSLLEDISRYLALVRQVHPEGPIFLYGHSLGGSLVLNYCLRKQPILAGVIVTAPGLVPAFPVPAWKTSVGRLLYRLRPEMQMASGLEASDISRDPRIVAAYCADPLIHDRISCRMGIDVIDYGSWALSNASQFRLPLLLMQGSGDRIVSIEANRLFAQNTKGETTIKLWDGLYHEVHNEPEKDQVIQYMISWINRHACN